MYDVKIHENGYKSFKCLKWSEWKYQKVFVNQDQDQLDKVEEEPVNKHPDVENEAEPSNQLFQQMK